MEVAEADLADLRKHGMVVLEPQIRALLVDKEYLMPEELAAEELAKQEPRQQVEARVVMGLPPQ